MQLRKFLSVLVPISMMATSAFGQTTVTSFAPFTSTPTPGVWYEADVRTGGTASIADLTGLLGNLETAQPLPIGAAKLTTDLTTAAKAEVAVTNNYGVLNDILGALTVGYSWHKAVNPDPSANEFAAPSIKLTFANPICDDPASSGDCFITLVWEAYQDRHAPTPPTDTWTREDLDADTGGWWTTGGFGTSNGFGGCGTVPCPTLRDWHTTLSSDFGQATLVAVSVGVGSYNLGQIGYFDKVDIAGTSVADASYDFDIAPAFETVGECVSTLIADNCAELKGRARANCNHEQQFACFDLFDIP
jgi:hypothetical protein